MEIDTYHSGEHHAVPNLVHPALAVARGELNLPDHPEGGTWAFYRQALLADGIIGIDPVRAAGDIEQNGFHLIPP